MSKGKQYTDGQLLEALLQCGTVEAAAQSCGCSKRTIYVRMQDSSFTACLNAYRAERLRQTAQALDCAAVEAVQTLQSIMQDDAATNADKIRAAALVLDQRQSYADKVRAAENTTAAAGRDYGFDDLGQVRDIWESVDG